MSVKGHNCILLHVTHPHKLWPHWRWTHYLSVKPVLLASFPSRFGVDPSFCAWRPRDTVGWHLGRISSFQSYVSVDTRIVLCRLGVLGGRVQVRGWECVSSLRLVGRCLLRGWEEAPCAAVSVSRLCRSRLILFCWI